MYYILIRSQKVHVVFFPYRSLTNTEGELLGSLYAYTIVEFKKIGRRTIDTGKNLLLKFNLNHYKQIKI